ncbi:hypothetical protein [Cognatiluteimonas weifangensis]|uniref:Uncharacterized protein n=1 Tax=Cognatiluteimonas weifangensis TaxID=2303539 RepID=A0A372DJR0_9GAMM|nr:hypothetical protein [Luteimonas weifangensis]RFP59815.1 hypothetical protein D0Y53_09910 [Luteimonas weifangensis]
MHLRSWWSIALVAAAIGWWYSPLSPRAPTVAALAPGADPHCPPPPRVTGGQPPLQSAVPAALQPFRLAVAQLQPLAGFSVEARVLSRKDYRRGREAELSPTDLALGWGAMAADGLAQRLDVTQSGRWYHYRWSGAPPLPPREIARSSANMHLIPAGAAAAAALRAVRAGERVRIDGWLVQAEAPDGWRWRSSLSREDTGAGACELVYVCTISRQ